MYLRMAVHAHQNALVHLLLYLFPGSEFRSRDGELLLGGVCVVERQRPGTGIISAQFTGFSPTFQYLFPSVIPPLGLATRVTVGCGVALVYLDRAYSSAPIVDIFTPAPLAGEFFPVIFAYIDHNMRHPIT